MATSTLSFEPSPIGPEFKDREKIVNGPLFPTLIRLAVPAVASSLFMILFEIIDMFWVGKLGSASVAAISTASFLVWILRALALTLATGGLALVSRRTGENNPEAVLNTVTGAVMGSLILAALVFVLFFPITDQLFLFLKLESHVGQQATIYSRVFLTGLPFVYLMTSGEHLIRGMGNTRTPTVIAGIALLLNLCLDPLFIFHFHMGLAGAAVATVISQIIGCSLMLIFLVRMLPRHKGKSTVQIKLLPSLIIPMIRIGIPISISGAGFSAIYLILSSIVSRFGSAPLAALGIGHRIEAFPYFIASGLAQATAAMVGQNLGAGKPARARSCTNQALWISSVFLLFASLVFLFFPHALYSFFIADPEVIEHGIHYIRIVAIFEIFLGFEVVLEGAFSGAGETLPLFLVVFPFTLLRIPLAYLLGIRLGLGVNAIWMAISGTTLIKGISLYLLFRRNDWQHKKI